MRELPTDLSVTYGRLVVGYRPQKKDLNLVRLTASGKLISYPGKFTTHTADLVTSKIQWNSVLSTAQAKYICINIKTFTFEHQWTGMSILE